MILDHFGLHDLISLRGITAIGDRHEQAKSLKGRVMTAMAVTVVDAIAIPVAVGIALVKTYTG